MEAPQLKRPPCDGLASAIIIKDQTVPTSLHQQALVVSNLPHLTHLVHGLTVHHPIIFTQNYLEDSPAVSWDRANRLTGSFVLWAKSYHGKRNLGGKSLRDD